ncbi:hypothetical protein [Colwellia piezophila]|uniref:hypothetical protein n=1 Tax=Colwellia piezophila TaxID=211668 RepID=UPI00036CC13A|nr:hypothetical protein [Colwellia piezophila]
MFFVLVITAVFVGISIYFFFRTEKLQRQLIMQRRENLNTRKENKALVDSMALIAVRGQDFSKTRLARLKKQAQANEDEQLIKYTQMITPLINNYSMIFRECLRGKGRLKAMSQKCFKNQDSSAYKNFVALIVTSDKQLQRYWSNDNLNGFLFLVDALLIMDGENTPILSKNKKTSCIS